MSIYKIWPVSLTKHYYLYLLGLQSFETRFMPCIVRYRHDETIVNYRNSSGLFTGDFPMRS